MRFFSFTIATTCLPFSFTMGNASDTSPTSMRSTLRATSVGRSFIWNFDVRPSSLLNDMSPWLLRVSLSSDITVAASSNESLSARMSAASESSFMRIESVASAETRGMRSIWRTLILSPRLSMSCMMWKPYSDSTIFDTRFGSVRLNATAANAGSSIPRPT